MDKTRVELLQQCKDMNIRKCSSKTKQQLVDLICAKMGELQVCANSTSPPLQSLNNETPNSFRFIDLFCGIGGFHQAMNKMDPNSNCVFACDIDEKCRETYEQNYGLKPHGDITKIDVNQIPPFDILCGGFPCQSFSKAGNQAGFDDKRGQLFFNI